MPEIKSQPNKKVEERDEAEQDSTKWNHVAYQLKRQSTWRRHVEMLYIYFMSGWNFFAPSWGQFSYSIVTNGDIHQCNYASASNRLSNHRHSMSLSLPNFVFFFFFMFTLFACASFKPIALRTDDKFWKNVVYIKNFAKDSNRRKYLMALKIFDGESKEINSIQMPSMRFSLNFPPL